MCNENRFSESGAPIAPTRCADFLLLASDRDRLAGVVAGMEDQNARLILQYDQLDDIFRQRGFDLSQSMARSLELEKENSRLRRAVAPILNHAEADDYAPPLKFSVDACRQIRDKVEP